jgi:hypothetical protein
LEKESPQERSEEQRFIFQTRSEELGLSYHATLADALVFARLNKSVWKISFSIGNERVRLVRVMWEEGHRSMWLYEPVLPPVIPMGSGSGVADEIAHRQYEAQKAKL